jgi:hypothetical protein
MKKGRISEEKKRAGYFPVRIRTSAMTALPDISTRYEPGALTMNS